MTPESFQRIIKFLISFIEKDKQAEGLVEKLCHRFRGTHELTQWRDIAYCLSLMNYSERTTKKFCDLYKCYADKLADEQIYESFKAILVKGRKFAKLETKTMLDEFEAKMDKQHEESARDLAATQKAERASKTGKTSPMKIKQVEEEEQEQELLEGGDDQQDEVVQPSTATGEGTDVEPAHVETEAEASEEEEVEEEEEEEEAIDYSKLKVGELKALCTEREISASGTKAALIKRLEEWDEASEEDGSEEDGSEEESEEEAEEEAEEAEDFSKLTVAVLKSRLQSLGLPTDGKKAALVERMQTQPLTASRKGNKA